MSYQIGDSVLTCNDIRHPPLLRGTRGRIESVDPRSIREPDGPIYGIRFPGVAGLVEFFYPAEIRPVSPLILLAEIAK